MRRRFALSMMSVVAAVSVAACSSGGSKDSKSSKSCPVGTWQESVADGDEFDSTDGPTYTDLKGRLVYTFKANGDYNVRFDGASMVETTGGTSRTIAISGSYGGTYTVTGSALTTKTTRNDIKVMTDGVSDPELTDDLNDANKDNDGKPQTFACTGDKLTFTDDNGSVTLTRA